MNRYVIHIRDKYSLDTTFGQISLHYKNFFCYTLEDTVRAPGIKVYGHTAIPENREGYDVGIRFSNKFKREVLILTTEQDGKTIKKDNIKFEYVYAHSGNSHEDTDACILVAYNLDLDNNKIYGSAEKELFKEIKKWIDDGDTVKWIIINEKQEK